MSGIKTSSYYRGSQTSPRARAHSMKKSTKKFKKLISKTAAGYPGGNGGGGLDAQESLSEHYSISSAYSIPRLDRPSMMNNNQMVRWIVIILCFLLFSLSSLN
jgi:hypothetical protein